jgi:hypothetical protein
VFGRHLRFVPTADLTVGPDDLRVAVSKEQVKDAPNIEREGRRALLAAAPMRRTLTGSD